MALIWLRQHAGKLNFTLVGAIVMWFIGMTLLGLGIFNAFNPGDHTILANFGYSIALCFAPGLVLTLLAIGAYWYGECGQSAPAFEVGKATEEQPVKGQNAHVGSEWLRRHRTSRDGLPPTYHCAHPPAERKAL